MCNKKYYQELARKVMYAVNILHDANQNVQCSADIKSERDVAFQVASCDEEGGLIRALLLTRGTNQGVGIAWARQVLGMNEPDTDFIALRLYKNLDSEQPVMFHAQTLTDLLTGLRRWMDENNGMSQMLSTGVYIANPKVPFGCDGLTIFHDESYRDTIDANVTVLAWDASCHSGWSLRVEHDVDNSFESWELARDAFIECVAMRGEFSTKFIWQDMDTALWNVTGKSLAQTADSGT